MPCIKLESRSLETRETHDSSCTALVETAATGLSLTYALAGSVAIYSVEHRIDSHVGTRDCAVRLGE